MPNVMNKSEKGKSLPARYFSRTVAGLRGLGLAAVFAVISQASAQLVPSDPDVGCSVSASTVNGWFKSGIVTVDGVVNPANSVSFPNSPNCSFYEWSYHMFLWLTSPSPAIYGGG